MVTVYELVKESNGQVVGIGNSQEVEIEHAVELIKLLVVKAEHAPIGVVPAEWMGADDGNSILDKRSEDRA